MGHVLVLNASYEPLNITTWRRALVMMLKGKAESLESDSDRTVRPGMALPTVIRLRQFVHVPFRQLPLTRRNIFHRDGNRCQYCGCLLAEVAIFGFGNAAFILHLSIIFERLLE